MEVEFTAPVQADGSFETVAFRFTGSAEAGWAIERDGKPHLDLGPGYRLLRSLSCGVCATDLARRFLPFPLPQITGHEVLAVDDHGNRHAVEINASHHARGLETDCPFCNRGLDTHCPERLVLGIHDLPGGFGPHVLAPVDAALPIPDAIPDGTAVLIEPLAAALHAVRTVKPRSGERIAVLGPRRLGMLVVAALGAYRNTSGIDFSIVALSRRPHLLRLAESFGATATLVVEGEGDGLPSGLADVVIDTTGNPEALALAVRLARREVHLKSTHGRPSAGLAHLTELVVDELAIGPFAEDAVATHAEKPVVAWLATAEPPATFAGRVSLHRGDALSILNELEADPPAGGLPRADYAVIDGAEQVDRAIRPAEDHEISVVRPRGEILVTADADTGGSSLLDAVCKRGLRLTSSRCGDFHAAIKLLEADADLRKVGEKKLITHTFTAARMTEALATAASAECIKAVVETEAPA